MQGVKMRITAGFHFTQAAQKHGHRVAISDGRRSLTFAELKSRANRIGSAPVGLGVSAGDRVGVLSHNRAEVVELWLGLERFAHVRVVLHSHFDMALHADTANQLAIVCVVFDARFSEALDAKRQEMPSVRNFIAIGDECPPWATPYEAIIGEGSENDPSLDVDENEPCLLQCTSGTTGNPKPWVMTHRASRALVTHNIEHMDTLASASPTIGPDDVNYHFHALQWASGALTLMAFMLRGAKTVLLDDETFDPTLLVEGLAKEQATATFIPGPMLPPILDVVESRKDLKLNLRMATIYFATPDLLERTSRVLGPIWCHGYGSTEQGGPTARLTAEDVKDHPRRLESVGRPSTVFNEMAVVDENGRKLPPNSVGEIVARSAMSSNNYWKMPEETSNAFFAGNWFRPKDIGYFDEDGFLYYLDRAKDRILTPGGVVYPHVVEAALLNHDSVANCGVVVLQSGDSNEIVAAVLLRNAADGGKNLEKELLAKAGVSLREHERPRRIVFVHELPTVLGGAKVQREQLQQALSQKDIR
jgi:acyl-CoA synthetase (AMP-forming)/AMP-acid ligase II